ncbi:MAG: hypothetical protein QNL12_12795 [Acidimicrobiia bacterium]|nr:hypothetical protein [Acidimicrobiia bacterium]MDX2468188.1 hypothetical protein [Acidimicrobiia bacterium]
MDMESAANGKSRLILGFVILATMAVVLATLPATTPRAEGMCSNLYAADPIDPYWGLEYTPDVNTCDQDDYYRGKVKDPYTDQSCVWVQFKEGTTVYTQGISCNSTGSNYTFSDQNGDHWSTIRICRNQGCDPTGAWGYFTTDY